MKYLELFLIFMKIGAFTFGGGYAMLPMIQEEVIKHNWMTMEELINFIAVSESTPGPFAINISTYVGWKTAGILGGIAATCGVVLPSFVIIMIIAGLYERSRKNKLVQGALYGLRQAVVGLIAASLLSVGQSVFFANGYIITVPTLISAGIFLVMSILAFKKLHPIMIICISAAVGVILGFASNGSLLGM